MIENKVVKSPFVAMGENQEHMRYVFGNTNNAVNGSVPSNRIMEQLYVENARNQMSLEAAFIKRQEEEASRLRLLEAKSRIDEKRDEAIYKRKIARELASFSAYEDANKLIRTQLTFPGGDSMSSEPVLSCSGLKLLIIESESTGEELYLVTWDNHEYDVLKTGCNARALSRVLESQGVSILVGKERRSQVMEAVFSFLVSKAQRIFLPETWGWNKRGDDRWEFIKPGCQTFESVKGGDRYEPC